jgi:LAO/AO transport system kinase
MGVADSVAVAMMPESGDSIQTLKAGVMEIADIYVINKADRDGANQMATAVTNMLHLADLAKGWNPPVLLTQAHANVGVAEFWSGVEEHRKFLTDSGNLERRRVERRRQEFLESVQEELHRRVTALIRNDPTMAEILAGIDTKATEPYAAALRLLADDGKVAGLFNQR